MVLIQRVGGALVVGVREPAPLVPRTCSQLLPIHTTLSAGIELAKDRLDPRGEFVGALEDLLFLLM